MSHAESFFAAAAQICRDISFATVEALATELERLRDRNGRLFLIGVGGSAANCSHAVNDFRKLCGIEAPTAPSTTFRNSPRAPTMRAGIPSLRLGSRSVASTPWMRSWSIPSAAAMPSATSAPISSRPSTWPRRVPQECSGSWGGTAAIPPCTAMWLCDPPSQSGLGAPLVGGLSGRRLALLGQPSSLAAQADEMVSPARGLRAGVVLDRHGAVGDPEVRGRRIPQMTFERHRFQFIWTPGRRRRQ
jgi:hypothetical protein